MDMTDVLLSLVTHQDSGKQKAPHQARPLVESFELTRTSGPLADGTVFSTTGCRVQRTEQLLMLQPLQRRIGRRSSPFFVPVNFVLQ
jgi:hypothetical protein